MPLSIPLFKLSAKTHAFFMLTIAHAVLSASCAVECNALIGDWASTNPIAFYGLIELACRTPSAVGLSIAAGLFQAPDAWALTKQQSEQQQPEAQQERSQRQRQQQAQQQQAVLNTWPDYKAYISAVASWCKAFVKVFPDACEEGLEEDFKQYETLVKALGLMLYGDEADGAGCLGLGQAPGSSSPTLQAVRLVLLLWVTRATLGAIKCCLRVAAAQHSHGASSSSTSGSCRACQLLATSSSSSSSSSSAPAAGIALVQMSSVTMSAPLLYALVKWQKTTSELTTGSSTGTSSPAAAAVADVSCLTTRKRLSRLPLQGLPEAVATQLDKCSNMWRRLQPPSANGVADEVRELLQTAMLEGVGGGGLERLQNFGREMVVLLELLLEEVPSPLGCNNPGCSNLSGFTEADEAGSVCTRCQEARYCSRQCQVDHWEQHKKACRRLRKQAEAAAAAVGGSTLQAEKAGGTGGGGGAGKGTKASRKGVAQG